MNASIARIALRHGMGLASKRWITTAMPSMLPRSTMTTTMMKLRPFSAATNVADLIQKELAEENDHESTAMPNDLALLHKTISRNWTILDDDNTGMVKLVSKATTTPKVSIVFHCQDTLEAEYDEADEQEGEEDTEPAMAVRFAVLVTKAAKTVVFSCLSEHAQASVETVAITSDGDKALASGKIETELYQGPEFTELAVELQNGMNDYVATVCGVDNDVAAFIAMYADYKEQNEYVKWLKDLQKVIA